ncbi:MAG: hypothetical protein COB26_11900 [Piscirickettsiaceae bacterium]|nr:MAG: hypothetical protein COB26_11900 [Piscirickettsiaceae bacterium]
MSTENPSLLERLKEGLEKAKKPFAYILVFIAVIIEALPDELLPASSGTSARVATLLVLSFILMEILFEIHETLVKKSSKLIRIKSNDLFSRIARIVKDEKHPTIQYIGVAGRHGWQTVIEKLLVDNSKDSVLDAAKFEIEIALINPKQCEETSLLERFDIVGPIIKQISKKIEQLSKKQSNGALSLYTYDHMPNMIGFLVNDNYLFLALAYIEKQDGEKVLRAGGTDYFIYSKNDLFGGQEAIKRFQGWFQFIKENDKNIGADTTSNK